MGKFKVIVGLADVGIYDTFVEAYKILHGKIKELLASGTSWQMLDTTNFIEFTTGDGKKFPMDFYQARDFAYRIGLLAGEGELQDNATEPSDDAVEVAFRSAVHESSGALRAVLEIQESAQIADDMLHGPASRAVQVRDGVYSARRSDIVALLMALGHLEPHVTNVEDFGFDDADIVLEESPELATTERQSGGSFGAAFISMGPDGLEVAIVEVLEVFPRTRF